MIKIDRTTTPAPSLAVEAKKKYGSYTEPDVIEQLSRDFHDKCYICELKASDCQVEHLLPHHNRKIPERVFDWNNLFYSCPHCNSIKNQRKYEEKVIKCRKEDPETLLNHIFTGDSVLVQPRESSQDREDVKVTADLIQNCFEKSEPAIRNKGSQFRFKALSHEMNVLFIILKKVSVHKASCGELRALRAMLSRKYAFAAFIRYYVKSNLDKFPGLEEYID